MNFLKKNVSEINLSPTKYTPNKERSIVHENAIPKYCLVQEYVQQDF